MAGRRRGTAAAARRGREREKLFSKCPPEGPRASPGPGRRGNSASSPGHRPRRPQARPASPRLPAPLSGPGNRLEPPASPRGSSYLGIGGAVLIRL
ncbi:dystrophia myotonica WD repeat-containing protein-like [Rattus rattus]|uniref:dystrophia myotonica WD repeat-containing protein-like n=1 Tax=Rattus rattus TaxID=10117 RepID=UPI0013F2C6EF|nr:dystrophia myotonica WD repeat-containing protein-like [Rattus rattus]